MNITLQILIALLIGSLTGIYWPKGAMAFSFLGDIFLAALKMLIMPLIITSIISGITSIGSTKTLGKLGAKTILYYFSTTIAAVIIGIFAVNLLQPGKGFKNLNPNISTTEKSSPEGAQSTQKVSSHQTKTVSEFLHMQIKKIFMNPVTAAAQGNVLGVIVFALILGIALIHLGQKAQIVTEPIDMLLEAIMKAVHWVMYIAPLGIFGLIAKQVATTGSETFFGLAKYMGVVLIGLGIHAFLVLTPLLYFLGKLNPLKFYDGIKEALLLAFSTSSSSATMPVTITNLEENLEIPNEVTGFVIPLGATINMDGTALYEAVAALFIAQFYGIDLNLVQQIIIALTATLAAIGAAGIPSAGLITMSIVLTSVGLPLEGIGMILAVDRLLDMCRTTINVYGDAVGTAIIAQSIKKPKIPRLI